MFERGCVLIVDDEPFILSAVAGVLQTGGFKVHTCELWAEVATIVRREEPNLIMLDYNMPTLKGDSICAILRRNITSPGMKIVLFSSEPEMDLSRIADECGADGYIRKNTSGPELVRRVHELISMDGVPTS